MAGRSSPRFNPMNLKLPSATTAAGHHRGRPPFVRTASNSSAKSTTSEDSFMATLKSLTMACTDGEPAAHQRHAHYPSSPSRAPGRGDGDFHNVSGSSGAIDATHVPHGSETPGRKQSRPIAIEPPGRERRSVCTPLSARGELQGGYFPNHEEVERSYRGHPFEAPSPRLHRNIQRPISSPSMSNTPSPLYSPSENTPTQRHMHYPGSPYALPALQPPELYLPRGKYYPSNYKKPASSASSSPKNPSSPIHSRSGSGHAPISHAMTPARPSIHQRRPSEVKQKLQQYQRQMIQQAQMAKDGSGRGISYTYGQPPASSTSPKGPKLVPVVGQGEVDLSVITPLELEASAVDGYLASRSLGSHDSVSV